MFLFQDTATGSIRTCMLEGVEMNMMSMQHLKRYIKMKSPSPSCEFEVVCEGESKVELTYTTSTALSSMTLMDVHLGGSMPCCLNQNKCDTDQQVSHQDMCIWSLKKIICHMPHIYIFQ